MRFHAPRSPSRLLLLLACVLALPAPLRAQDTDTGPSTPSQVQSNPDDFSETVPMVEGMVDVDVDVGRVRVLSELRDEDLASLDLRDLLRDHAGDVIGSCYEAAQARGEQVGPAEGEPENAELILSGQCLVGVCEVNGVLDRTGDRQLASCMADAVGTLLTGRPETQGRLNFRVPLRFRLVEEPEQAGR